MALFGFATSIATTLGAYALYTLLRVLYQEFTSPLRNVPGPPTDHWFLGNRKKLLNVGLILCGFHLTLLSHSISSLTDTRKDCGLSSMVAL
jgi:hypothetical protein